MDFWDYCASKGTVLKGRQFVKMIIQSFETDRRLDKIWQMEDLYKLEYPGDEKMGAFRYMWHLIVTCLRGEVTRDELRKVLRKRLGDSKALAMDISHYDRQESVEGSKDFSYEFLLKSMDRALRRLGHN